MKAVVYEKYGPPEVLQIRDIPKPEPHPGEILIRVRATTVTAGDWRMRKADPWAARLYSGLFRPLKVNVLGFELSGDVEAVGPDVQRFQPGDAVLGFAGFAFGAYAEYRCLPVSGRIEREGAVVLKPANLTYEEAAALPSGALTARTCLRKGKVRGGQSVLIYGASGSVGTYAVQIARYLGAQVTGVCSTANLDLVKALGAQRVIDYTREDFTRSGQTYDVVFDAVGKTTRARCKSVLKPGGVYLSVMASPHLEPGDLDSLRVLAEAGAVRPVIDRCYPLEQIVAAHRYVEAGHKKGNVVVTVA